MSSPLPLHSLIDHTINGLVVGNIYALLAVGLALIYGVSHLINFAHGSIYMVGAYIGWFSITRFGTPLPVTLLVVVVGCGLLGMLIERVGLRPLQSSPRIAPLLSTIGIALVLDQVFQLIFTPDPRAVPSQLPDWRIHIAGGTIGALDILIAAIGIFSALILYVFLRFTKLGWAVRATALDRDAAQQCGVDVNRVNSVVFAIAAALGGVSGLLVGMYYNTIDPNMGYQAGLKGIIATLIGGMGNVPGAIAGSILLGLIESYGIAAFGASYRNLFAFVVMLLILVLKPNGIFNRRRGLPPEPLTGTFIAPSAPLMVPAPLVIAVTLAALALPLVISNGYILQTLGIGWLFAIAAVSLTLVAGTAGQISLGHAGLLALGAYASALLALNLKVPVALAILAAGVITAVLGTLLIFPSFRLRGHYVTVATLGVGEIITLVILNWDSLTQGPIGLSAIPPLSLGPWKAMSGGWIYEIALVILIALSLLQHRLLGSHLGRTLRAIRDDDVAARSYGIVLDRYKSLAFGVAGFSAGVAGAVLAHTYSYINHETFTAQVSLLALTMVILGGLGNIIGAITAAVLLVSLPEVFRVLAEYRLLIYGIVLLLLIRFRPQGLFGTM
ncbi:MAG: ABC transporter permease [Hyphomicrobiaceae bacterium]